MPLTPQISLAFNLGDLQGDEIGSSTVPAYVRIALCNTGPFLPRIPGTAMIAKVGPYDIPYLGTTLEIEFWGNDVIVPVGTYYAISILDDKKNVLQTGAYVFTGSLTGDFSVQSPMFPNYTPSINGAEVSVPFSATPNFNATLVNNGQVVFNLGLSGNVTGSTVNAPQPGQIIIFKIQQDATGGRTFTWPTNVQNPGVIDPAPNSKTVQAFYSDSDGNLYPLGSQTWN